MDVALWIHRLSGEKTASIMKRVMRRQPFVKVRVENGFCILKCHDTDDALSYICDYLSERKLFMGRWHMLHKDSTRLHRKTSDRFHVGCCRFGFWDVFEYPSQINDYDLQIKRLEMMMGGKPMYMVEKELYGNEFLTEQSVRNVKFKSYVYNLKKYHGKSEREAIEMVSKEFPGWDVKPDVKKKTPDDVRKMNELEKGKIADLISKLRFYTPSQRRKYLMDNLIDMMRFVSLYKKNGREWVLDTIGEIKGIIDRE